MHRGLVKDNPHGKELVQPAARGPLKEMTLFYASIPLMLLAVTIAVVPLLWSMTHQTAWDENSPSATKAVEQHIGVHRAQSSPPQALPVSLLAESASDLSAWDGQVRQYAQSSL